MRPTWMSQNEYDARVLKISKFFTTLQLNAAEDAVEGYVQATLAIPWRRGGVFYFTGALLKVIQEAEHGFGRAPLPKVILEAAESLIPSEEIEHDGHGPRLPRWWRLCRLEQRRLNCANGHPERQAIPAQASAAVDRVLAAGDR